MDPAGCSHSALWISAVATPVPAQLDEKFRRGKKPGLPGQSKRIETLKAMLSSRSARWGNSSPDMSPHFRRWSGATPQARWCFVSKVVTASLPIRRWLSSTAACRRRTVDNILAGRVSRRCCGWR
jgi:hypothetical protein